jgi:hypothetical protein
MRRHFSAVLPDSGQGDIISVMDFNGGTWTAILHYPPPPPMYYIVLVRSLSLYILTSINIYGTGVGRQATAQTRLHFEKQYA